LILTSFDYIDVNDLSPLSDREVHPPSLHEGMLKSIRIMSLVISHCDYPLDWIKDSFLDFESIIDEVWVFIKCNRDVTGVTPETQVIPFL
jgi:hypothetical protein